MLREGLNKTSLSRSEEQRKPSKSERVRWKEIKGMYM
jgi:hypothetical protein